MPINIISNSTELSRIKNFISLTVSSGIKKNAVFLEKIKTAFINIPSIAAAKTHQLEHKPDSLSDKPFEK